jgi:predicted Fe-Mo cluster-binding NifX family protein
MSARGIKVAVPLEGELVSAHFGHPECFSLLTIEPTSRRVLHEERVIPPPHEPGLLPVWLSERGVSTVLTGGMGPRAIQLLETRGIEVLTGVPGLSPREAVLRWLAGTLPTEENRCDNWIVPWNTPESLLNTEGWGRTGHGRCHHERGGAGKTSQGGR